MKRTEHSLTEEQLQLAAQNPIFRSVALSRLAELLEREVLLCSFRKDEIIYSPDHFEERIGLFLSGTAVAEKSKGTVILNTFEAGSCYGVATLFSQSKRYVTTIRAKSDCLVAFLSGESMIRLFREEPQISLNYIAFLASRIHFLNRKIDQFTAVSAEEKLTLWLLEQAERSNPFRMPVSYAKLAEMLDLGRSSLYRALDALEAEGLLKKDGKLLEITDISALEHWSER